MKKQGKKNTGIERWRKDKLGRKSLKRNLLKKVGKRKEKAIRTRREERKDLPHRNIEISANTGENIAGLPPKSRNANERGRKSIESTLIVNLIDHLHSIKTDLGLPPYK